MFPETENHCNNILTDTEELFASAGWLISKIAFLTLHIFVLVVSYNAYFGPMQSN